MPVTEAPTTAPPSTQAPVPTTPQISELPRTGSNNLPLVATGLGLVGLGGVTMASRRRVANTNSAGSRQSGVGPTPTPQGTFQKFQSAGGVAGIAGTQFNKAQNKVSNGFETARSAIQARRTEVATKYADVKTKAQDFVKSATENLGRNEPSTGMSIADSLKSAAGLTNSPSLSGQASSPLSRIFEDIARPATTSANQPWRVPGTNVTQNDLIGGKFLSASLYR